MDLMNLSDELKFGKVLSSGKYLSIMTPLCRLDFLALVEPQQFEGKGDFKFSADLIFETDPTKPGAVDLKKVLIPALVAFAKEKNVAVQETAAPKRGIALGTSQGHPHVAIRIGERITQEGEPYAGYEASSIWMKASSKPKIQHPPWKPIACVSPSGEKGFDPGNLYNGCWGRVIINPYKPANYGMITFGLQGVQMIADGDALGADGGAQLDNFGAVEGASVQSSFEKAVAPDGDFSSFLS